ncbi:precorrin-6A reductase [Desulfallas sp. Bu1-1]|uniref:precorrin-6A reductase n=1 Tax=Desulfallas sp. Bu1-1 TaxID=2787620 RepID=UPI001A9AE0BC|nr:precorrin-6A reductase [Desulfallas sp. Bu1-1]
MILILSGTGDGRKITQALSQKGYQVGVVASTGYGRELAVEDGALLVRDKLPVNVDAWLAEMNVVAVVDARHPFVCLQDKELIKTCAERNIMYLRVRREETSIQPSELIYPVYSMQEAAEKAASLGKNIFLTTGSHDLELFVELKKTHDVRLVVRVLPEHRVIKKCQDLGIKSKDIVAMQGPFSKQINKALFKMYKASVIVTKDSGKAGGTDTKIDAALSLKIPVVIVKRSSYSSEYEFGWEEIIKILQANFPL